MIGKSPLNLDLSYNVENPRWGLYKFVDHLLRHHDFKKSLIFHCNASFTYLFFIELFTSITVKSSSPFFLFCLNAFFVTSFVTLMTSFFPCRQLPLICDTVTPYLKTYLAKTLKISQMDCF